MWVSEHGQAVHRLGYLNSLCKTGTGDQMGLEKLKKSLQDDFTGLRLCPYGSDLSSGLPGLEVLH